MPRSTVEVEAAQALFAARMMVAALHDSGPWEMRWGSVTVPATREFTEAGVRFTATFPELCWLARPGSGVEILCDGVVMGIRPVTHPGDTEFVVAWEFATAKVPV